MKNLMKSMMLLLFSLLLLPLKAQAPKPLKGELQARLLKMSHLQTLKQIQKNHPKLNDKYAVKLAIIIDDISRKYKVRADKLAAIAMQESSYDLDAQNCYVVKGKLRCDFCMMQINDRTVKAFGFNKERLMVDVGYCIEAGAMVLRDFKRMYGKKEIDYWTRYNSSDPEKREAYKIKVARYL